MKILFQGDSITDASRSRDEGGHLGVGYPTLISAQLGYARPGEFEFVNRAVSGFRVVDLYAGWKIDAVNHAPDVISILVGVNDVWHEAARQNGVEADRYELVYNLMLDYTQEKLPHVKLMLLEPFVLPGVATEEKYDWFRTETEARATAVRRVASAHGAMFVPLQAAFDAACRQAPASYWLRDGVHPTAAGHQLIADKWLNAFFKIK